MNPNPYQCAVRPDAAAVAAVSSAYTQRVLLQSWPVLLVCVVSEVVSRAVNQVRWLQLHPGARAQVWIRRGVALAAVLAATLAAALAATVTSG